MKIVCTDVSEKSAKQAKGRVPNQIGVELQLLSDKETDWVCLRIFTLYIFATFDDLLYNEAFFFFFFQSLFDMYFMFVSGERKKERIYHEICNLEFLTWNS